MAAFCFQNLWDIAFDMFLSSAQFENEKKKFPKFSTHRIRAFLWAKNRQNRKKKILSPKEARIWWVKNVGTIFFPFSNWAPGKNLSNAMSQRFWKQNAAILSHFENLWFFQKWGGRGGGLFIKQDIVLVYQKLIDQYSLRDENTRLRNRATKNAELGSKEAEKIWKWAVEWSDFKNRVLLESSVQYLVQ